MNGLASQARNGASHSRRDSSSSISSSSSASSSDLTDDSEYWQLQAQREWDENMRQLQLAVSVLIMPTIGKWLGRRWAYNLYARYITVGWSWALILPARWLQKI